MSLFNRLAKAFKKISNYIKSEAVIVEKNKAVKMTGMAVGAILCVVIFSVFFTTGYEVYLGGEKVAVVFNKSDFEKQLDDANNRIVEIAGKGYGIVKIPKYVFTVAAKTQISKDNEILDNVMSQSTAVTKVYYINIDGNDVAFAQTSNEASIFLERAASVYAGENRQILNDVKIVPKYEKFKYFSGEQIAIESIAEVLRVQTESEQTYKAEIIYSETENLTDTMFVNEKKVVSKGENGVLEVTAKVTKVNGRASNATVLSSKVIKEPIKEVVMVGSKDLPSVGTGNFVQPFYGAITSRFGARWGRTHTGTDIAGETGSPIKAADNGIVITAEYQENGYGNIIIIDHNNGLVTYYAHLNKIDVNVGDIVQKGNVIGELGNTGRSTGPHLHFEVRENGNPINPEKYLENLN